MKTISTGPITLVGFFILIGSFRSCPTKVNDTFAYRYNMEHFFTIAPGMEVRITTEPGGGGAKTILLTSQSTPVVLHEVLLDHTPDNVDSRFGDYLSGLEIVDGDSVLYRETPSDEANWWKTRSMLSPEGGENALIYTIRLDSSFHVVPPIYTQPDNEK